MLDPREYGPVFARLLAVDRCRPLGPGCAKAPGVEADELAAALTIDAAFAHAKVADREMAELCLGAVWLLYDQLDRSHEISQRIETPSGSYWHGIMHRREPDYANSKYWFRRVGQHRVFEPLGAAAHSLAETAEPSDAQRQLAAQATWDPNAFVDLCEAIARGQAAGEPLARQVAQCEWELLFDHCYRAAQGLQ